MGVVICLLLACLFGYGFVFGLAHTILEGQKGERAWFAMGMTSLCLVLCICLSVFSLLALFGL